MSDALELWENPESNNVIMFVGWRQWADAGKVSSGLPEYLIQQSGARRIGRIQPDGFYIFQFPGTHDLVRPVIKFNEGYPESLDVQSNEIFFSGDRNRGFIYFVGDEPHLDIERYAASVLEIAKQFRVRIVIGFGGVYGELPYDKDRMISATFSLSELKEEISSLSVNLSNYQGGASIGSFVCRRAGEQGIKYISFYAFVPTYDFSAIAQLSNSIRIEHDYMAWLGILQRVNHFLKIDLNLSDLEKKSQHLIQVMNEKIQELDQAAPQSGIREYIQRLSDEYTEVPFAPLDDVWEEEIRRLFDKMDPDDA